MKPTPATAAKTPSAAYRKYSQKLTSWNGGSTRKGWAPNAARPTTSAVTDESTTTAKLLARKLMRMISRAKNTPASGALKVAEIPPAAPQATSSRSRESGRRSHCPSVDPSADPIWTIGPSRPTEPPEPMSRAEASDLITATRGLMRPPFSATATMTSGTPWPRASRANLSISGPKSRAPITGTNSTYHAPREGRCGLGTWPRTV